LVVAGLVGRFCDPMITGLLLSMAMAVGGSWRPSRVVVLHDPIAPDLPCPWCRSATFEDDSGCRSCGQPFGR
jgi:hypothetical protein